MKYALNLAPDGRILSATYEEYASPNAVLVADLPSGETEAEQDIHNYLFVNGGYVYDPLPTVPDTEPPADVWAELDAAYREGVNAAYDQ